MGLTRSKWGKQQHEIAGLEAPPDLCAEGDRLGLAVASELECCAGAHCGAL
jgi:hypothetical protein